MIKILQINIRGINRFEKLDSLCLFIRNLNTVVDVIVVGETWLKEARSQYYNIPDYQAIHSCRRTSAGGLAIFIRKELPFAVTANTTNQGYHHIAVKLHAGKNQVLIHGFYRPPDFDAVHLASSIEAILANADTADPCLLVGDMNLPVNNPEARDVQQYTQLLNSYGMAVTNSFVTRPSSTNILDHVVCSVANSSRVSNYTMDCDLSDHSYVLTVLKLKMEQERRTLTKTWTNYTAVNDEYRSFLQEYQLDLLVPNERLQAITERYALLTKKHTRTTTVEVKVKHNCCPWFNYDIWKLSNIKDKVLQKWKANRLDEVQTELLARANLKLNEAKRKAKANYHSRLFCTSNPKLLWSRINEVLGGKSKANSKVQLEVNHEIVEDPSSVSNIFNDYFASVGVNLGSQLTSDGNIHKFGTMKYATRSLFLRPVTSLEVQNIIFALDPKKAQGYDGFPVAALKRHSTLLASVIKDCFNECVSQGEFPACLKRALVHPVFKGGDPTNPSNYRPISVLPVLNKVFEKLLFARIYNFLIATEQLYRHQFGFRKGSSTEVAILELVDEVSKTLDDKLSAGSIFLDLSKAFDTINHQMLLKKLESCGLRGLPNALLQSYLSDRIQQVVVSGIRSEIQFVRCGVPQGSVLGPLLFLIYVNDMSKLQLHGKTRLFADDTAISYACPSPVVVVQQMKEDMELVFNYLENNLLALNLSKTKRMIFRFLHSQLPEYPSLSVRNTVIEEVACFKYLGVYLDNRFNWDNHVRQVIAKCSSLCGILRRLSRSVPHHVLLKIYLAYIHSRYRYAIAVWGSCPKVYLKELQVQQNRCIKAVYKLPFLHPTRELYSMPQHKILPMYGLYTQSVAVIMYRILNNVNIHHNWEFEAAIHDHYTRGSTDLRRTGFRTELGRRRFKIRGPTLYNELPENMKEALTVNEFKRKLTIYTRENLNNFIVR